MPERDRVVMMGYSYSVTYENHGKYAAITAKSSNEKAIGLHDWHPMALHISVHSL